MITVGIDMIPSCMGVAGFWSMSIFMTSTFSPSSPWSCSTIGAIMRQGPHQVAQKSTSTGLSDFRTLLSKSVSLTVWMFPITTFYSLESDFEAFDSAFDSAAGLASPDFPEDFSEDFSDALSAAFSDAFSVPDPDPFEVVESEPLDPL